MLHDLAKVIAWRNLKIQNTLFEATSIGPLHWSMKKSPVLQELKIDDQKKKSHRPSPCDLESHGLSGIRVAPFVQKIMEAEIIS